MSLGKSLATVVAVVAVWATMPARGESVLGDIALQIDSIAYTGGVLNVSGTPVSYLPPIPAVTLAGGSFTISVKVDASGMLIADTGNQLTVTANQNASDPPATYLTGNVVSFEFLSDADPTFFYLKFGFDVTGGTKALDFGPRASLLVAGENPDATGSFTSIFSGNATFFNADLQGAAVPLPAIAPLAALLLGAGALGRWRRR